jgi:hypothetical protein
LLHSGFVALFNSETGRSLMTHNLHRAAYWSAFALVLSLGYPARVDAQMSFEDEPINYYTTPVDDPVARLQQRLDAGEVRLEYDAQHGYLPSVLKALGVSHDSQMLVFSKTSLQLERISPSRPRAIYFNDDVYVGWVQHGPVMEISAADPRQGAVFYTLAQRAAEQPRFVRDRGDCMSCHASSRTLDVPGHLVRSVYPGSDGHPHFGAGTFRTNHSSPFSQRWGGWYVTGTHGALRHMGNVIAADPNQPEILDREAGANVTDLTPLVDTTPYLPRHSDLVALMVLEHQVDMHNWIARANYDTRRALRDGRIMNQMLQLPEDHISDSTRRRIENAGQRLLKYLLFADEAPLSEPVRGTSGFAERFSAAGPRDAQGRSLRELDLQRRLFRYPCSYLIYCEAFRALPDPLLAYVQRQLWEILTGRNTSDVYAHLSAPDRLAILQILRDTWQDLPDFWSES